MRILISWISAPSRFQMAFWPSCWCGHGSWPHPCEMTPCRCFQNIRDPVDLSDRLRNAGAVTADCMAEIVRQRCRRFPSPGHSEKTARLARLIGSDAWTDAAVALIDLELPQWQIRRIAYDEGEWYCALSRERELPDWLDHSIEARHADLALALLAAFVEAQDLTAPSEPAKRSQRVAATPVRSMSRSAAIISPDAALESHLSPRISGVRGNFAASPAASLLSLRPARSDQSSRQSS